MPAANRDPDRRPIWRERRLRTCPGRTVQDANVRVFLAWHYLKTRGIAPFSPRDPVEASIRSLIGERHRVKVRCALDLAIATALIITTTGLLAVWLSQIDAGIALDLGLRCVAGAVLTNAAITAVATARLIIRMRQIGHALRTGQIEHALTLGAMCVRRPEGLFGVQPHRPAA